MATGIGTGTRAPGRPRRGLVDTIVGGWRHELARPGAPELVAIAFSLVVMSGVVLAGVSRAQVPHLSGGVAIAIDPPPSQGADATSVRVEVRNDADNAFAGQLVVGSGKAARSTDVSVAAGDATVVEVPVEATCDAIPIHLEGPGAPETTLTVTGACADGETP